MVFFQNLVCSNIVHVCVCVCAQNFRFVACVCMCEINITKKDVFFLRKEPIVFSRNLLHKSLFLKYAC